MAIAPLAVAGIIAGCGTATRPIGAPRVVLAAHQKVPGGGSPAEARVVGRRMITSLILPPDARHIGPQRRPQRGEVVGSNDLVDLSRFYWLPLSLNAASSYLQAHVPVGDSVAVTGSGNNGGGSAGYFLMVSYALKRLPVGIDQGTNLLATLATGPHGGTIMRADAEVVWYPPRSAAEYINRSAYRSVSMTVTLVNQRGRGRTVTVTRTFGKPVIARLAKALNGLRTLSPPGPISCPMMTGSTFTARLIPVSPSSPTVVIGRWGCIGDLIKVGGRSQPVLLDFESSNVIRVIRPLFGLHRTYL
jgi:hypothetical protein